MIKLEQLADAKAILDKAKSNGAKGEVFDKRGEGLVSVEKTKNINLNIQNPPQKQLQFIVNLYNQNKLQQTLTKTSELIRQFPSSVTLHNISGAANAGLKQYKEAVESYRKAININPNYAEAHNNMGNALHDQGDLDKAIEAYNKAPSSLTMLMPITIWVLPSKTKVNWRWRSALIPKH